MTSPKITVIIPTRERRGVLEHSLRTVTAQNYDNLEIIVSDNYSNDDTQEVVQSFGDSRIRYLNTGKRLSMSHNWDFALSHAHEGWVTFIGDDDGLLPSAVQSIAEVIGTTKAQAIRSSFCTYDWPGMPEHPKGQLIVPLTSGMEVRNSSKWLARVLQGKSRYNQLPMIYNGGFIHTSILEKIKSRLGSYFLSVNPDVFTAIAVARLTDDYVYIHRPIAISGTSRYSNGHSAFSTHKDRNREPYKKFLEEGNIPFHAQIPTTRDNKIPLSLHACVYEAYLQSEPLGHSVGGITPENQIQVILATSGKHRKEIEEWGETFAHMHNMDLSLAIRQARSLRMRLQSRAAASKLTRALHSVITDRLPISNIHEASIAAAVILSSPSRVDTMRFIAHSLKKFAAN